MAKVWVFFYGTFMSSRILHESGVDCEPTIPAKLNGYKLSVGPRANLKEDETSTSYGGLAHISHRDLSQLYSDLNTNYSITYNPFPVIAMFAAGKLRPALCYISFDIQDSKPEPGYVDELASCAAELGAPETYIEHIRSFK